MACQLNPTVYGERKLSDGVLELLAANILFGACEIVCFIIGGHSS